MKKNKAKSKYKAASNISKSSTKNIIAVVNQKGGVGKTTSVLNVASGLVAKKYKVLVVDLDPQGNATTGSGIEKNSLSKSLYDVIINGEKIASVITKSDSCGFDILPTNRHLAGAEVELVDLDRREHKLGDALQTIASNYDVILIDCPPSLSLLTLNGLSAANYILVPVQCEYYALEGLSDLLNTVSLVKQKINPSLEVLGLVRTMFDKRNKLATQVSDQLFEHFNEQMFNTSIPRNVRLAEAPSFGISAVKLDSTAAGSRAYITLAKELKKRLDTLS